MPDEQPTVPEIRIADRRAQAHWQLAGQGELCPPSFVAPDEGIDLLATASTLVRGWRIIATVMALVGVVGIAAVSRMPGKYRASTVLQCTVPNSPDQPTPIADARFRSENNIEPAVLKQLAGLLKSEENLRKAAADIGMDSTDEGMAVLLAAASAEPSKDSPDILVSVTLPDPGAAKQLAEAWVNRGLQSQAEARLREIEAIAEQLRGQRDEALKDLRSKQQRLQDLRHGSGVEDKRALLNSCMRELAASEQELQSNQSTIRLLEARIDATKRRLESTPRTSKETQRIGPISEVLARLATQPQGSPFSGSGLQVDIERPNPTYEMLESRLVQDGVALDAARGIVEAVLPHVPVLTQQIQTLQAEVDESSMEFEPLDRVTKQAQTDFLAADKALTNWRKEAERHLPSFVQDRSSSITAQAVGSSPLSRLVLLEAGAFMLGCMVVLIRESHRKRTATTDLVAAEVEAASAPIDGRRQPLRDGDREPQRIVA